MGVKDLGMQKSSEGGFRTYRYCLTECSVCEAEFRVQTAALKLRGRSVCNKCKNVTHGKTGTKLHHIWLSMKKRCLNKKDPGYKNYGGRGIYVCDLWLKSFQAFYSWCLASGYASGLSLDRAENDGPYSPDNCRWADRSTQQLNSRMSCLNTSGYVGVTKTASGNWLAYLTYKRTRFNLGTYIEIEAAVRVRDAYIVKNGFPHRLSILSLEQATS